jgi:hypothetical protein
MPAANSGLQVLIAKPSMRIIGFMVLFKEKMRPVDEDSTPESIDKQNQ